MGAGTELREYSANLLQAKRNVLEVKSVVNDIQTSIDLVQMAIEAVDAVQRTANTFGNTIGKMQLALKLMDKAGPLKVMAKIGMQILDAVKHVAQNVEDKARQLAVKIDNSGLELKLDKAEQKVDAFEQKLIVTESAITNDLQAVNGLIRALDTIDTLDGNENTSASLAASADQLVIPPNAAVGALNAAYAEVKAAAQSLKASVPGAGFVPVLDVRLSFDRIDSSLDFMKGPLDAVARVLKPVEPILNAVGFIFDITVGPIINYLLNALGIQKVLDSVSNKIAGLLPDSGVFDNILATFDTAFLDLDPLGQLDDHLGIAAWTQDLLDDLLAPVGNISNGPIGIGTATDDVLAGSASADLLDAGAGNDTIDAGAGNDVMLAGAGNDFFDGGAGDDNIVFAGNFFEYTFVRDAVSDAITFDHARPQNPRVTDGIDETRNIENFTFADISLTRTVMLEGVRSAGPGQTLLTGTDKIDLLFAGTTGITLEGLGDNDMLYGGPGNDILRGGNGDDVLVRSGGTDQADGGAGSDTWRFLVDNSSGNPHVDVDLVRGNARVGGITTPLLSIENVVVEDNRTAYLFGSNDANRLAGGTSRDLLDGRNGDDILEGGAADDVLIGGVGNDKLHGGAGNDALAAGDGNQAGVSNFYDGGDGWADLLTYAADLNALVNREYFDTGLRNQARFQQSSGPLRVFAETGIIERLSSNGLQVLATDTAVNIEVFAGSDSNDVMYGAPGPDQSLDGGAGNDVLYAQLAGGSITGGAGDDIVNAGIGGAAVSGGDGFDILDLTGPDGVRWLVRLDGSLGSSLRVFNALEGKELAVPGGSLQNDWGPSLLSAGNVSDFDLYIGGSRDDYFELRSYGAITVRAGDGNDYVQGRSGGDSSPSFALYGEAGDDHLVLQDAGLVEGGEGEDLIEVDASSSAALSASGGVGDDVFRLRGGKVTINGGEGIDILAAGTNPLAGLSIDLTAHTVATSSSSTRFSGTISGIEVLLGSDSHDDILKGSAADETLAGAGGADLLEGRAGDDALYGGAANDQLFGDGGDDLLHGGAGNDVLNGGDGTDTASWAFATPGAEPGVATGQALGRVDADLASGLAQLLLFAGGSETDTLASIESLVGGAGNDTLRGDNGANLLAGGAGSDLLDGRGGDDVLVLDGNDTASGGAGNDRFVIGLGQVAIDGGAGNDVIDFGSLRGTVQIDVAAGTYTAGFEVERPVWRDTGGVEIRSIGGLVLTPQLVLEADPEFMNSLDDLSRLITADSRFEIGFATVVEEAGGNFSGIEHFTGGAAVSAIQIDAMRNQVPVVNEGQGWTVNGTINLDGIDRLRFADGGLALDLDGSAAEVARLLGAVFGPESVHNTSYAGIGLAYKDAGMSYEDLGALALQAAGANTPQQIVNLLWTNVVGSAPSAADAEPYIAMLENGLTSGELAVLAAETEENAARIDLVGLQATGLAFV